MTKREVGDAPVEFDECIKYLVYLIDSTIESPELRTEVYGLIEELLIKTTPGEEWSGCRVAFSTVGVPDTIESLEP